MKAKQAIDLLENGIMPCVLTPFITSISNKASTQKSKPNDNLSFPMKGYQIDYICGYNYQNFSVEIRKVNNSSEYTFITLNGNYLYANDLNEEISINNNSSGGGVR